MSDARGETLDVLEAAGAALARDGRVTIATIIDTWGSSPVPVGGQMLITSDGTFQGSVSGGCVEGEVIAEALELLEEPGAPRVLTYGVADETAWRGGLPCGGGVPNFGERLRGPGGKG